jgi:hypothetical protein
MTIRFTGETYTGFDGNDALRLDGPGDYEVSDTKGQQLVTDFPGIFQAVKKAEEQAKEPPQEPEQETAKEPVKASAKKGK